MGLCGSRVLHCRSLPAAMTIVRTPTGVITVLARVSRRRICLSASLRRLQSSDVTSQASGVKFLQVCHLPQHGY